MEGAIGEMSSFHATYGYYAEGIHIDTAVLPEGWQGRLVGWDLQSSEPARPRFLEAHDLAIAKLAAGREKDMSFVRALILHHLLDVDTLFQRTEMLSGDHAVARARVRSHLEFYLTPDS